VLDFTLPPETFGVEWGPVIDTAASAGQAAAPVAAGATLEVVGRSIIVLTRPPA
jgi:hypothetical protein